MFVSGTRGRDVAVLTLVCWLTCPILLAEDMNMEQVIRQIQDSERKLLNIHVEGSAFDEVRNSNGQWAPTETVMDVTAWLNGLAGGPARIDVHRDISQWVDGPAAFGESSSLISWNGQRCVELELTGGPKGDTIKSLRTIVYSKIPPSLFGTSSAWGGNFSINYYHMPDSQSLSQWIGAMVAGARGQKDTASVAVAEGLNGVSAIRITIEKTKVVRHDWWVDPSRGFAFLRYEYHRYDVAGNVADASSKEVLKLTEAGSGIWYPIDAVSYFNAEIGSSDQKNNIQRRLHYMAKSVRANDPGFDGAVFDVAIPA